MDQFVIVPAPRGDGFVELSRSRMGRVFRKQILPFGKFHYGDDVINVDEAMVDSLIQNFSSGVADIVQVPKVDGKNAHTEDPDRNIGEVIALTKTPKGLYADIDARTDDSEKLGKTLLGASAMLHLNYTDTRTGKKAGPTLLHVAVTNRPHIVNLEGFEEVIAASRGGADISEQVLVLRPADNEETDLMTREEMLAALKAEHGIDVEDLQAKAEVTDKSVALSNKIQEQLVTTGLLTLSNTDEPVDADTLIGAVVEAGNKIVELSGKVDGLMKDKAEATADAEVEKLVLSGHILPKKKDAMVTLFLKDKELFDQLVPEQPIVKLSHEEGLEPTDEAHAQSVDAEIVRLSAVAEQAGASVHK